MKHYIILAKKRYEETRDRYLNTTPVKSKELKFNVTLSKKAELLLIKGWDISVAVHCKSNINNV